MLPLTLDAVRLWLHLLAATVWVGGQLVVAGLLPVVRGLGEDAPGAVARRFGRIAWVAFGVLVATGVWSLFEVQVGDRPGEYLATLLVKLIVVAVSGAAAAVHAVTRSRRLLAAGGAVSAVAAVGALLLGVQLRA